MASPVRLHTAARADTDRDASLLLDGLARQLHASGAESHQLERQVAEVADALGLETRCFATPTALILTDEAGARLIRVQPGAIDLSRRVAVEGLADRLATGTWSVSAARTWLEVLERRAPRHGPLGVVAAFGVSGAAVAQLFGGTLLDVAVAALLGLIAGLVSLLPRRFPDIGGAVEAIAGASVAGTAVAAAAVVPVDVWLVTLAGLIVFLPGYTLTVAISELTAQQLSAGSARLARAGIVFLQLTVGAALGLGLATWLPPVTGLATPPQLATWVQAPTVVAIGLALAVLFEARPADRAAVVAACGVALVASHLGAAALGPALGGVLAAALVAAVSNLHARWRHVPAAVMQVPGVLLLVPGSVGLSGLHALLGQDVTAGVQAAFTMFLTAGALATGLVLGNALVPVRRARREGAVSR